MRSVLLPLTAALLLSGAIPAAAQLRSDDARSPMPNTGATEPGTPLGTGPARGSDDRALKPVPGPGATTGDSSGGVSGSAPQTSTGSAPPPTSSDRTPDMERIPAVPPHGGSSSGGIGGGATAPGRSSGENAPAGRSPTNR